MHEGLPETKNENHSSLHGTSPETCCLCGTHEISCVARSYADVSELVLQHQRNGHRNFRDVAKMYNLKLPAKTIFCRTCVTALSTRFPIGAAPSPRGDAPRPGYRFHADTVPLRHATKNGERHILLLVDDYSRAMFLRLLKLLSESVEQLKDFVVRLEAHFGRERVVAQLRTDSASYFSKSTILKNFCDRKGIELTHSPPYTQALNGVAERHVRTVLDVTRALLIEAGAPVSLWGFAVKHAVRICNRFYNRATCQPVAIDAEPSDDDRDNGGSPAHTPSPLELFAGRTLPNQRDKLKVWGCTVYPLSHAENPDKFDPRAEPHCHLGVDDATGGFICGVLPHCNKTLIRAHCVFHESERPLKATRSNQLSDYRLLSGDDAPPHSGFPIVSRRSQREWTPTGRCLEAIADGKTSTPPEPMVHTQAAVDIANFVEDVYATDHSPVKHPSGRDPKTHREAMSLPGPSAPAEWRAAEIEEFRAHLHNKTFGPPTKLPPGRRSIPADFVFKTKRCTRKKVRVVVKGFHMKAGIDFNETFAPVAVIKSIRFLLALCAQHDLELLPFDIKTAFLSADMDTEVYVTLPPAFNDDPSLQSAAKRSDTVHRLLKGVPGIPQGSRLFNSKLHAVLVSLGFARAPDDYCLYAHATVRFLYIVLWTDDGYIFHKNQSVMPTVIDTMKKNFDMKFLKDDEFDMLGVTVTRNRPARTLTLSQADTIEALLVKAGMKDCKPAPTPVSTGFVFTKKDCPGTELEVADMHEEAQWYRSILASTIYIVKWTRADCQYALSKLGKFQRNPGKVHIQGLKRFVRYLKGTAHYKLAYDFSGPPPRSGIYAYFDSAHNDDVDTGRSTMAYLVFYEGCLLSWFSKLHTMVTTSTNHSEYVASAKCAREAAWWHKICLALRIKEDSFRPIATFSDSNGAICMNYNPVHHEANKHVALADHYTREQVELGYITVTYVPTKDMLADALTKALSLAQWVYLVRQFLCCDK